jgi:hypothetical protein
VKSGEIWQNDCALFESPDLKSWKRPGDVRIPGTSEGPEFFEIASEDDPHHKHWASRVSAARLLEESRR